jgi:activator of 2-hydroxyglutaryl-CoA dehydratase
LTTDIRALGIDVGLTTVKIVGVDENATDWKSVAQQG